MYKIVVPLLLCLVSAAAPASTERHLHLGPAAGKLDLQLAPVAPLATADSTVPGRPGPRDLRDQAPPAAALLGPAGAAAPALLPMLARQGLLYGHALLFAFAIVIILREDLSLLRARRIDAVALQRTQQHIVWLLTLLWLSGGLLIVLDTGWNLALALAKPKLAAKLSVVTLLTVNGVLLHRLAFPMLTQAQARPLHAASVCAVLGAVSSVSWLYASFVGVARLIAPSMAYTHFLTLYALALLAGLSVAWIAVRPRLEALIARNGYASSLEDGPSGFELSSLLQRHAA